ncbi:MAG: hypothetical protein TE42_06745, partial [Candidatus Synechococcus spongiarum SP3]
NLNATVTLGFASGQDIRDTANNDLTATTPTLANDNTYVVDNMAPTLSIAVPASSTEPFTATFSFSEKVEGFAMDDVTVDNGVASSLINTIPGEKWTALITPAASGTVTVEVAAGGLADEAGNAATTATRASSTYTAPPYTAPQLPALNSPQPAVAVDDARVQEGAGAMLQFQVRMVRPPTALVTVDYATEDGTATAGTDYIATSGSLTFLPGQSQKTLSVAVLKDALEEGDEHMWLKLSNPSGFTISDGEAVGVIVEANDAAIAWQARFGRTVTTQVLEAVEQRLQPGRQEGALVRIAGQTVPPLPPISDNNEEQPRLLSWNPSSQDWVTGSSFALTTTAEEDKSSGGHFSLWGLGAIAGFDGRQHALSLDGQVTTALMGADWATGQWTAGLALGHSTGAGHYRQSDCATDEQDWCSGDVEANLTGLYPYVGGVQRSDRRAVWAAAGYGRGDLTLRSPTGKTLSTDLTMTMGAAGLAHQLLQPNNDHGFSLAIKGDARFTRTMSEALHTAEGNLAADEADVWLIRAGIEAARPMALGSADATFTPSLEMGVRLDGGDADTGFGTDIGTEFAFASPQNGINLDLKGRGLMAHEAAGFQEWGAALSLSWDPQPSSERGLSAGLTQTWGASPSGGMDALLQRRSMAEVVATDHGGPAHFTAASRLELELSYGLPLWDGAFTATPNIGFGISEHVRDYRIGWRLSPAPQDNPPVQLQLEMDATRSETTGGDALAEHEVTLRTHSIW